MKLIINALFFLLASSTAYARIGADTSDRELSGQMLVVNLASEVPADHEVLADACGGHLASGFIAPVSQAITNLLNTHVDSIGADSVVWLGGVSEPYSNTWAWTDGMSFSYTNWSSDFWSSPSKGSSTKYTGASMYSYSRGKWMAYYNGWASSAVYMIPSNYADYPECDSSMFLI